MPTFMQLLAFHLMIEMVASVTFFQCLKITLSALLRNPLKATPNLLKLDQKTPNGCQPLFPFVHAMTTSQKI